MKVALVAGDDGPLRRANLQALASEGWQLLERDLAPPEDGVVDALVLHIASGKAGLATLTEIAQTEPPWETIWSRLGRPVAQAMVRERRGRIVLVTSAPHLLGSVRPLALELAPHGVTVNAVAPSAAAMPEEVAHLVRYLCSEEAGFVTAQTLRVGAEP